MQIFLDSADISEIKQAQSMGLIDGVTTNPSLMKKIGIQSIKDQHAHIKEICKIVKDNISAEVISTKAEGMFKEGVELYKCDPQKVVVKIPMGEEGLKAVARLSRDNIRTNMTLIFSPLQALLAAKAGACFVSPFVGRLDDITYEGVQLVQDIATLIKNYDFSTKVLAASVRHPLHILKVALIGADMVTLPLKVLTQLIQHPLTQKGLEQFLKDAGV